MDARSMDAVLRMAPFRARGLAELEERVGSVVADIDAMVARKRFVRVLEVGCGYATALLQLGARFGPSIELHGINVKPSDGDEEIVRWNAARLGLEVLSQPILHYVDANEALPFPADHFDVIFSQVTWLYLSEKLGFISEVGRLIASDGLAKIQVGDVNSSDVRKTWIEIWKSGRRIPFEEYVAENSGLTFVPNGGHGHLIVRKPATLTFGDDLVSTIPLARLNPDWVGVRSIYHQQSISVSGKTGTVSIELEIRPHEGHAYEARIGHIPDIDAYSLEDGDHADPPTLSSYREVCELGQGRWCVSRNRFGYSVFLSHRANSAADENPGSSFRLTRPFCTDSDHRDA